MIEVNEQLAEVISNSRVAFINGQMAEAFKLAKEAINLMRTVQMLISVQQMCVCRSAGMRMQLSITKKL